MQRDIELQTALGKPNMSDYKKLYVKLGKKKVNIFQVVKDSADSWYFKPIVNDTLTSQVYKGTKTSQLFLVPIKFNSVDSIPLLADPRNDSKIIAYLHKESEKAKNYLEYSINDQWFVACKGDFIKVLAYQKGEFRGWISKEYFFQVNEFNALKSR